MSNKYLIVVLILVALVLAGGGYYWKTKMQKPVPGPVTDTTGEISKTVSPAIDTSTVNPAESEQSADPYDKTNPFSNIRVNPFE